MKPAVLFASVLVLAATAAGAGPLEEREAFMKENGRMLRAVFPVVKGEKAFDAAEVLTALQAFNAHAQKLDAEAMFPAGSEGGEAAPAIWTDRAGFEAAVEQYKAAAAAAADAAPHDVEALRAAFGRIGGSCENCHETYRIDND